MAKHLLFLWCRQCFGKVRHEPFAQFEGDRWGHIRLWAYQGGFGEGIRFRCSGHRPAGAAQKVHGAQEQDLGRDVTVPRWTIAVKQRASIED